MRHLKKLLPTLLVVSAALTAAVWTLAAGPGDPAELIPYGGRLEENGTPVEGPVSLTFRLYDDANPSNSIITWSETHSVTAAGGRFAVVLGETSEIPPYAFRAKELYVEVEVGGTSLGLQRIHAVANAQRATQATEAFHAVDATNATNATYAILAAKATALTCDDDGDAENSSTQEDFGICVVNLAGDPDRYVYNFEQAIVACAGIGMHLCSSAEMNVAYAGGYRRCDYGWVSDWISETTGRRILPSGGGDGCGNPGLQPNDGWWRSDPYTAYCCR